MLDRLEDFTTQRVDVSPFSDEYEPMKDIPIDTCTTDWTDPETGRTYIIIFNQMLYFGDKLKNSLLCPNQIRDNGNAVEDTPRQWDQRSSHSVILVSEDRKEAIFMPPKLEGVISCLSTCKPKKWS